ncbi:HNH endonuclease, partial [Ornithobacterium rhinotracheale]|uniref:HNH endonuclease n=1 Tax=Ornithobacterium rhinotracheale TaxID=28251 RepID=UPI001FF10636
ILFCLDKFNSIACFYSILDLVIEMERPLLVNRRLEIIQTLEEEENRKKMERERREKIAEERKKEEAFRKEEERLKKELRQKEEKERLLAEQERLQKLEKDRKYKEAIKKRVLEEERKKQLDSEAIRELIQDGLLTNYPLKYERKSIPSHVRENVWMRDKGQCVECGSHENLEFDHIIPISRGGANTIDNIQILCLKCNRKKGNKIR